MFLSLVALSGIAWSIVYLDAIRVGMRDRTYAMPLFALGLNISWEVVYSIVSLTGRGGIQGIINICWAVLDAGILYTYFRYGRRYWPQSAPRWLFIAWSLLAIAVSLVLQFLFLDEFGSRMGGAYSAFLQNLMMSILFVNMFAARRGTEGQSLLIAVAKWIGTLAPTVAFGVLGHSLFLLVVGALCGVFDLIYIGMMLWARTRSGAPTGELWQTLRPLRSTSTDQPERSTTVV